MTFCHLPLLVFKTAINILRFKSNIFAKYSFHSKLISIKQKNLHFYRTISIGVTLTTSKINKNTVFLIPISRDGIYKFVYINTSEKTEKPRGKSAVLIQSEHFVNESQWIWPCIQNKSMYSQLKQKITVKININCNSSSFFLFF